MEERLPDELTVYDLQPEIATEARASLDEDVPCAKNPGHPNFIRYDKFQVTDIPETYRTGKLYRLLKNVGDSVVRITVFCENGTMRYGSGVIMKYRGILYIYTNNHVIETDHQAKGCIIDFNYNDPSSKGVKQSLGTGLLHTFSTTDKSMITFDPVPEGFYHDYMPDSGRCRGIVNIPGPGGTGVVLRGLACVHNNRFCVLMKHSDDVAWTEDLVKAASVYFREFDNGERINARFSTIVESNDDNIFLELDPVPDIVRMELEKEEHFWEFEDETPVLPIVIAHPHGGPKMVTMGQKIEVEEKDDEGVVMQHSAATCAGSSGGAVIAVADDNRIRGLYAYLYLHCKGKKTNKTEFDPQIDSHNMNTSSLSIWL